MTLREKLEEGFTFVRQTLWIVLVPILLDTVNLLLYQQIFKMKYVPTEKFLHFQMGIMPAPPSFRFVNGDFPSVFLRYEPNEGLTGILSELNLFNVSLGITLLLIFSFIKSGYFGILTRRADEEVGIKDFFIRGNGLWYKFFLLQLILLGFDLLAGLDRGLWIILIFRVMMTYVPYVMVVEEGNIGNVIVKGIFFFFENLWLTIKIAYMNGILLLFVVFLLYFLQQMGIPSNISGIPLIGYFGVVINKAVLETYREVIRTTDIAIIDP